MEEHGCGGETDRDGVREEGLHHRVDAVVAGQPPKHRQALWGLHQPARLSGHGVC